MLRSYKPLPNLPSDQPICLTNRSRYHDRMRDIRQLKLMDRFCMGGTNVVCCRANVEVNSRTLQPNPDATVTLTALDHKQDNAAGRCNKQKLA